MRSFYIQTIEFNETIGVGSSGQKFGQVDTGGYFVCESIMVSAWIPSTQGSAIAGTPFANAASPTASANTMPTLTQLRLQINVAGVNWFSNPIRCNVFGPGVGNPFYFQTKPVLPPLAQIQGQLYNDVTATFICQAQVSLVGYRTDNPNA